jgi:pyruvate,water dikinase
MRNFSNFALHESAAKRQNIPRLLTGTPVSAGTAEGPCAVIGSVHDLLTVPRGAILVCAAASPELAVAIPFLKGLVTERGGLLSILATYAREYEIPAVFGVDGVMDVVRAGDIIRVDGAAGAVELIARGRAAIDE